MCIHSGQSVRRTLTFCFQWYLSGCGWYIMRPANGSVITNILKILNESCKRCRRSRQDMRYKCKSVVYISFLDLFLRKKARKDTGRSIYCRNAHTSMPSKGICSPLWKSFCFISNIDFHWDFVRFLTKCYHFTSVH